MNMIKLTNLILENNLREYSDEERQKMGIPSGATSRGGHWYVGDKYAGKVVGGKFVAAAGGKVPPSDTPKTKTTTPTTDAGSRFGTDTNYLQVRDGATPAERKLVGKVSTMFDKVAETPGFYEKHANQSYPAAEFEKMTGISSKAAKAFTKAVQDYESPFSYDEQSDTVDIHDPMDV